MSNKKKQKLGQEPAFQTPDNCKLTYDSDGNIVNTPVDGMSKRFYAACAAMQGLISNCYAETVLYGEGSDHALIQKSYILADELLEQENK